MSDLEDKLAKTIANFQRDRKPGESSEAYYRRRRRERKLAKNECLRHQWEATGWGATGSFRPSSLNRAGNVHLQYERCKVCGKTRRRYMSDVWRVRKR